MRFFLTFGFLASIIQCGCLPIDVLSDLPWPDESLLAAALKRVKKDADAIGYLEECTFVESWQEQPGFINVLAFLDASWEYSHRQATMLKMLQGRLERSGITGIKFFVINSAEPEAAANTVDVEDEREAWGAAEPTQNQTFAEIVQTGEALKERIDPDIGFIQDNDELKIWEKLSASRDQVIVIDKCGRLSYRVIVPWSILHFPYVKAAILSTYKEQPCGGCNFETTTVTQNTESQTEHVPELLLENLNIQQMKEIAVKTYNLDETDNTVKKAFHGAESQDLPDNVVKLLNGSAAVKNGKTKADLIDSTKHGPLMSTGNSNSDSYLNSHSLTQNLTEDNQPDDVQENLFFTGDTLNIDESREPQSEYNSSLNIINESTESIESETVSTIENESRNDHEKTDNHGDNYNANDSISTESSDLKNISKDYEEQGNLGTDSYSVEGNDPDNGYVNDKTSDLEVSNTSKPLSSEQTDNHINKMALTSGENNSEGTDYVMPIRIIMRAPHIHEYEEPTRKYEYLVLRLGNPEYHGHLEYDNDFALNEKETRFETDHDSGKENDEVESGSGEIGGNDHKKKHQHHGRDHGRSHGHKHSKGKHLELVYDKDESPGFYGEDAEYWRNFGNADDQEKLIIEQPEVEGEHGEDNETYVGGHDAVNISESSENNSTTIRFSKNDTSIEESTPRYQNSETDIDYAETSEEIIKAKDFTSDQQIDKNNTREEEIANRLFVHYSKLIPWLDYVIDE